MYSLEGYYSIHLQKRDRSHPFGGVHGISLFFKEMYVTHVEQIKNMKCNSLLWFKADKSVLNVEFILGVVYIPHEGSKYYSEDIYDALSDDCIELSAKYNLPFLFIGDWNARTGVCSDFVDIGQSVSFECDIQEMVNDISNSKYELENAGISTERFNVDKCTNNNGCKLLEFCKASDNHIVNGRFGADKCVGKTTCADKSTIDYVLASPSILPLVTDFEVDLFDILLSDKHNPIIISLSVAATNDQATSSSVKDDYSQNENMKQNHATICKTKWFCDRQQQYFDAFKSNEIQDMISVLDDINPKQVTQAQMDNFTGKLCQFYLCPAESAGFVRNIKSNKSQKKPRVSDKAWFGKDNEKLRSEYFKIKNEYRRTKSVELCNEMKAKGKSLKKLNRKAKKEFKVKFKRKVRSLKNSKPREYWNLLKNSEKRTETVCNISTDIFKGHFKKLSQNINVGESPDFDPTSIQHSINDDINFPFTIEEIQAQIRKLKNSKASGVDYVLN